MKKDITSLFCLVDDFAKEFQEELHSYILSTLCQASKPSRVPDLSDSEIMTIVLMFQESPCRNFKFFYKSYLQLYLPEFPCMPTYERFVALMPRILWQLVVLLFSLLSPSQGIAYIDSTALAVCHPKRISQHKVCQGVAALGKTTKGWFFGLKLHIIIDGKGNLMRIKLTPGNIDERQVVDQLTRQMTGLLLADKGYICKVLFLRLFKRGLKLVTGIRKKMRNMVMPLAEKIILRKRSLIETVFDYLKNKLQLEHTRHRSPFNAFIHIIATLIVYQLKPSKPSLNFQDHYFNP